MVRLKRSGLRAAVMLSVVGIAVSGCAVSAAPAPDPAWVWERAARESAYSKQALVRAVERERLRKWDPCAMHVPKAAEKVTGDASSAVTVGDLNECTLRMASEWTFYLKVGVQWPIEDEEKAAAQKVDGTTLYRNQQEEDSCKYVMPVSEHFAVGLTADTDGDVERQECEVAHRYVTELISLWKNPPLRKEKRTTPYIALATKNPCEVPLMEAQRDPDPNAARTGIYLSELYQCTVQDVASDGEAQDRFTVEFILTESAEADSDGSETTVSGQFARAVEQDDGTCKVLTDFNPDVVVDSNSNTRANTVDTPVVKVTAGSCEQAKSYLERVLEAARS